MRYRIAHDITVRSENAAKPAHQKSRFLADFISGLPPVSSTFDYGCGKLRYKDAILECTDTLAVVDSEVQLSREQVVHGRLTSVRKVTKGSNRLQAHSVAEFAEEKALYDRGFCINVLSVIPFYSVRRQALHLIRARLKVGGVCLFAVQYRNSDFTRMRRMKNARAWRDGFLIDSLRGFSFYGLISPPRLVGLVKRAGFEVVDLFLNEGSAYLLARNGSAQSIRLRVREDPAYSAALA